MNAQVWRDLAYLLASVLFIFDLKMLAHPRKAVRGNYVGAIGMAIAILATVLGQPMTPGVLGYGSDGVMSLPVHLETAKASFCILL